MYQALIEKFSEVLLPLIVSAVVWFGVHYFELTERIVRADFAQRYAVQDSDVPLPIAVQNCIRESIVPETLALARVDAAIYTATFRHVTTYIDEGIRRVEASLENKCGVAAARERYEQAKRLARQKELFEEAERLKQEAIRRKQEETIRQARAFLNLFLER